MANGKWHRPQAGMSPAQKRLTWVGCEREDLVMLNRVLGDWLARPLAVRPWADEEELRRRVVRLWLTVADKVNRESVSPPSSDFGAARASERRSVGTKAKKTRK